MLLPKGVPKNKKLSLFAFWKGLSSSPTPTRWPQLRSSKGVRVKMARQLRKADFNHVPSRKCHEASSQRILSCSVIGGVTDRKAAQPEGMTDDAWICCATPCS